jgi:hypothetical protein
MMRPIENMLLGQSYGRNTGFPVGQSKIIGDGYWISYYLDAGLVGILFWVWYLLGIFSRAWDRMPADRRFLLASLAVSFLLFNTINSGFDLHANILLFPLVVSSLGCGASGPLRGKTR